MSSYARTLWGWDTTGQRIELTRYAVPPKCDALSTLESEYRSASRFELCPPPRALVRSSDLASDAGLNVASGPALAEFYGDESQPLPGVFTL